MIILLNVTTALLSINLPLLYLFQYHISLMAIFRFALDM